MASNAQETDKAAIAQKFRAELPIYTLDEVTGKAPYTVGNSLRSDTHVEAYRNELLRLQAKTPRGDFWDKIEGKRKEAEALVKDLARRRHLASRLANKPLKGVGSGANRGQMAAMILSAHIKAGTPNAVQQTLKELNELCEGLVE